MRRIYNDGSSNFKVFVSALIGSIIGAVVVGMILVAFVAPKNYNSNNTSLVNDTNSNLNQGAGSNTILLPYDPSSSPAVEVVKSAGPAVVKVTTKKSELVYGFFGSTFNQESVGNGSGVIIDTRGYILTNNHVIEKSTEISVTLVDGRSFDARIVGADAYTDLAVLKIEATNLTAAVLGNSDEIQIGEMAIAIGNPYGFDHTVTSGLISALNRVLDKEDGSGIKMEGLIQTEAPINPGNSGGALLSVRGEVIGINTAIISNAQNIGFAIPINTAKEVANEIIAYGKVKRPYSGILDIVVITPSIARWYNLPVSEGIYVSSISKNSPASKAGIEVEDIIIYINGNKVTSLEQINLIFNKSKIGDKMEIKVINRKSEKDRTVVLTMEDAP